METNKNSLFSFWDLWNILTYGIILPMITGVLSMLGILYLIHFGGRPEILFWIPFVTSSLITFFVVVTIIGSCFNKIIIDKKQGGIKP